MLLQPTTTTYVPCCSCIHTVSSTIYSISCLFGSNGDNKKHHKFYTSGIVLTSRLPYASLSLFIAIFTFHIKRYVMVCAYIKNQRRRAAAAAIFDLIPPEILSLNIAFQCKFPSSISSSIYLCKNIA